MASNGDLTITTTQGAQSVANNNTQLRVQVSIYTIAASYNYDGGTGTVTINGTKYSFRSPFGQHGTAKNTVVFDKTVTVPHNADGTKKVAISVSFDTDISIGTTTASKEVTLTTIPRKTEISALTATMGATVSIALNRKSSNFTHVLKYEFGSASGTIATSAGASASWAIPKTLANQIPNAISGTGKLICETYSGSTLVGQSIATLKLSVSSDAVPSFTGIAVEEAVAAVKSLGIYVQSKSKLKLTITGAAGSYGSTVKNYTITVDDQTIYDVSGTTSEIKNSGAIVIKATITDSRGRSASKSKTITVLAYSPPRLTSYDITRQTTPTSVNVIASGNIASLKSGTTEKNSLTYVIKYKLTTAGSYTSVTVKSSGLSFDDLLHTLTGIDATKTFDIQLVISDYFTSVTYPFELPTATVIMDWKKAGVGIGKYHEKGALDVAGDIYSNGKLVSLNGHTHTNLTIQGNGKAIATYNGGSAKTVNITPANIGAAAASHNHNSAYVRKGSGLDGLSLGAGTSTTYSQLAGALFCYIQLRWGNYFGAFVLCDGRYHFIYTGSSTAGKGFYVYITADGKIGTSTLDYDGYSKIVKIIPFFQS